MTWTFDINLYSLDILVVVTHVMKKISFFYLFLFVLHVYSIVSFTSANWYTQHSLSFKKLITHLELGEMSLDWLSSLLFAPLIMAYIPSQIFQFNQWNNLQKTFSNFCLSDLKISKLKNSGNQILSKQIRWKLTLRTGIFLGIRY